VLQMPDVLHSINFRLQQRDFDGEVSRQLEVVSPLKVCIEAVCPKNRTSSRAKGTGNGNI
jgi:hypothetical protein